MASFECTQVRLYENVRYRNRSIIRVALAVIFLVNIPTYAPCELGGALPPSVDILDIRKNIVIALSLPRLTPALGVIF